MEAVVSGVPLVGIPHWADKPTISKYVETMWGMCVSVRMGDKGCLKMMEVKSSIER